MLVTKVIAPPPTPNGDLHLGHLAGPYLAADVYRRYCELRGKTVVSAISIDANQFYVVTSAEQQGVEPDDLIERSYKAIKQSLAIANIQFDLIGNPDQSYSRFVSNWFDDLYRAGVFTRTTKPLPFDRANERFVFESFVQGQCPVCLSDTAGNICEDCGHPNDPSHLFGLQPRGGGDSSEIEYRDHPVFVFDMEPLRPEIRRFFDGRISEALRPPHQRLLRELLDKPLTPVPVTFPSSWGIPAPFDDADGLVINPWLELCVGHLYWLQEAGTAKQDQRAAKLRQKTTEYVQFLGFDNAYYYSVVHIALALRGIENDIPATLPTRLLTNEFYELGNSKFSTSKNAVISATAFLEDKDSDHLRYYLCRTNPETQRTKFRADEYASLTKSEFGTPWRTLLEFMRTKNSPPSNATEARQARALLARFEEAYDSPQASLRLAADVLRTALRTAVSAAESGKPFAMIASVLAVGAAPIVPDSASELFRTLGKQDAPGWPDLKEVMGN